MTMIHNANVTQTDALIAHYKSSSRTTQRNFIKWIVSVEDEAAAATVKDTDKVFKAICRGLEDVDNQPAMAIDEAEEMLKNL